MIGDRKERIYQSLKKGNRRQEDLKLVPLFQPVDFPLPVALMDLTALISPACHFAEPRAVWPRLRKDSLGGRMIQEYPWQTGSAFGKYYELGIGIDDRPTGELFQRTHDFQV